MTAFESFTARKTAEAAAATIHPFTTEADNGAGTALAAIGNAWSRLMFDGWFYASPPNDDVPAANLVFVQSRDGDTVAANPSTLGGGEADKHLIYEGLSRVAADAVLGGAGTIGSGAMVLSVWRQELVELRASLGLPRHPLQIVATIRGLDLRRGVLFNSPELRVAVITVAGGVDAMADALAERPWISPIVLERAGDLRGAFARLRALGVRTLSCIGGPTLAEELIDARLVRDIYLTTSPISAGEPGTPFYSKPLNAHEVVRKRGTGPDAGVTFQHLVIEPQPA